MEQKIVILTGAGVSAESGLNTYRDKGGIWEKYDLMELATPEAFAANPTKVHEFYNLRRGIVAEVQPNAAHRALANLQSDYTGEVFLVTQNVDNLHEKAGSDPVYHMHGELAKVRCSLCHTVIDTLDDIDTSTKCGQCGHIGGMRPHVVWFGEMPFYLEKIEEKLQQCDLFISIGTSGTVYPAAGFVRAAKMSGAKTVELNMEPSEGQHLFDQGLYGPATEVVPTFVDKILKGEI